MATPTRCKVCGGSLHQLRPGERTVCVRPEYRFVIGQQDKMPAGAYERFFAARAKQLREQERETQSRNKAMRLVQEKEETENHSFWQAKIAQLPSYRAEQYPLFAVPRNPRKLTNLPERRKRVFRDRLNTLVSLVTESPQAIYTDDLYPSPPPEAAKLLAGACALCKGACCLNGGEHA